MMRKNDVKCHNIITNMLQRKTFLILVKRHDSFGGDEIKMNFNNNHTLKTWLKETIWKLTDEGKLNEESKLILGKTIGFYEIPANIEYMANKGWITKK
jgi:hypothetical protein